jgi:hypothetical protein
MACVERPLIFMDALPSKKEWRCTILCGQVFTWRRRGTPAMIEMEGTSSDKVAGAASQLKPHGRSTIS